MTLKTTVADILETMGRVAGTTEPDDHPMSFRPTAYPDPEGPTGATVRVRFDDRAGTRCVTFHLFVGSYCDDMDVNQFRRDADYWGSAVRFGTVLVMGYDMGGTGIGEGRIVVRHSMTEGEVTQESVAAVLDDVLMLWQKSQKAYRQLKARHRVEERRRKLRETRIEMQKEEARREAERPRNQLDRLIGLAPVKEFVRQQIALHRVHRLKREAGLASSSVSPHLVFTGNPGTGKTTVAKIVAELYKELGLVSKGHLVVAERADLVANYVGQTAGKTRALCESAKGGVLFIDEAYSLSPRHEQHDFGREAIETLITFMEANRNDFAVIVAGYPAEMGSFIRSNPGLDSRFDRTVEFPDYSDIELMEILGLMMAEEDFEFADGARHKAFNVVRAFDRGRGFGNAREVRKFLASLKARHALLLADRENLTRDDLRLITMDAVPGTEAVAATPTADHGDFPGYL